MKKDTSIFLKHIIESIERIEDFTRNVSEEDFLIQYSFRMRL